MCGIVGTFDLSGKPASTVILKSMTDSVAHRGPDGEGHYVDGSLGLGHRRLAIIDLSPLGRQPMATSDQRYVISYNGEIYNYKEIRTQLQSFGHQFHSQTDTEVLLKAIVHWGTDALEKLNGMFASALWDTKEKTLLLSRDRYGIKPLYYTVTNNLLIFASEIKAIGVHPSFKPTLDAEALFEYFTFQNFLTNKTLHKNVKMLPAGCFVKFQLGKSSNPSITQYWDYNFQPDTSSRSLDEYVDQFDYLFRQAVNRQLISDVDVGTYLSGGMDSGSITAITSEQIKNLKTFTCGFDLQSASGIELNFDERASAENMSYLFKTEQYEMVLKAGDMERAMNNLSWHLEEPRVGQSYPNYYISRLASKFVKVVLGGVGGDELFGGYPWRYSLALDSKNFEDFKNRYYNYWQRLLTDEDLKNLFSPIWDQVKHVSTKDIFLSCFKSTDAPKEKLDYINSSFYFEAKTFLHGLLVVEDKLSMAHSLETRVPFLDNDLVEFAQKLPLHMKVDAVEVEKFDDNSYAHLYKEKILRIENGKVLLRNAMRRYLPDNIINRPKQGFSSPDASWFKGESVNYIKNALLDDRAYICNFLDKKTIHRLIGDHLSGNVNRRLLIWSLLSFEKWGKKFDTSS